MEINTTTLFFTLCRQSGSIHYSQQDAPRHNGTLIVSHGVSLQDSRNCLSATSIRTPDTYLAHTLCVPAQTHTNAHTHSPIGTDKRAYPSQTHHSHLHRLNPIECRVKVSELFMHMGFYGTLTSF